MLLDTVDSLSASVAITKQGELVVHARSGSFVRTEFPERGDVVHPLRVEPPRGLLPLERHRGQVAVDDAHLVRQLLHLPRPRRDGRRRRAGRVPQALLEVLDLEMRKREKVQSEVQVFSPR